MCIRDSPSPSPSPSPVPAPDWCGVRSEDCRLSAPCATRGGTHGAQPRGGGGLPLLPVAPGGDGGDAPGGKRRRTGPRMRAATPHQAFHGRPARVALRPPAQGPAAATRPSVHHAAENLEVSARRFPPFPTPRRRASCCRSTAASSTTTSTWSTSRGRAWIASPHSPRSCSRPIR
eukprot:scaffold107288_cov51-Phaeocystis_antarctica.AAC.1